jgi:hypothetical protein
MIEISQGFKTFWVYLKALFENYLKSSIYILENFFEKDQVPKYYFPFLYSNPMQAILQRDIYKMVYKVCYAKGMFYKYISKTIFIEFILLF